MRELEKHIYFHDTVVIGGNLPAFLYAYTNSLPIVFVDGKPPFEFDEVDSLDFEGLGLQYSYNENRLYSERYGGKEKRHLRLWERIGFLLGVAGLMPVSSYAESIRIQDNQLKIATERQRTTKINFNKLVIFDDEKVSGLTATTKQEKGKNRVIDWFNVRSGCNHSIDHLVDGDDFINKVIFYPTQRAENKNFKDLYAESYLTDEQLADFDYSETMARFKILKMMKAAGMRGERNGRNPKYPENSSVPYKYYAIKIEPAERVVYSATKRIYEPDPRFEFRYDTIEEALANAKRPKGYLGKLSKKF
jgi:hypothetical protein